MDGNDDLPNEFDVIVIGTGMVESIVAASASRIGKNVLHLDRNLYYGDVWATFGLENLEEFAKAYSSSSTTEDSFCPLNEDQNNSYPLVSSLQLSNLVYNWFIPSSFPGEKRVEPMEKEKNLESMSSHVQDPVSSNETEIPTNQQSNDKPSEEPALDLEKNSEESQISSNETSNMDSVEESLLHGDPEGSGDKETIIKEELQIKQWSVELLKKVSRKFNIDLAPKIIYSGGSMVELLLRSGVHRYTEFQSVSKILAYMENCGLEEVPCTKSQVFSCKTFSIIDKRILMKTLNYCVTFDPDTEPQYEELKEKKFVEVLEEKKTPEHLVKYILYSVAMSTRNTSMLEACDRIKLFFNNVGRYGHSPFLWPLYGSGELLQAFCRLSAVYGGIYYLGRGAEAVLVTKDTNACCGILSNNKQITAKHVITSASYCPPTLIDPNSPKSTFISRTILFTDRPLHEKTVVKMKESITMLHMLCTDSYSTTPVELIQLPSLTGACPNQLYVVQITCEQEQPCWSEVKDVIDKLFVINSFEEAEIEKLDDEHHLREKLIEKLNDQTLKDWFSSTQVVESGTSCNENKPSTPRILFAFHYEIRNTQNMSFAENKPSNLHFCHGPDTSIDFDKAVNQAKEIFIQMYPDEEFLEPTPDPNEITLSDLIGEDTSPAGVNMENEKKSEIGKTENAQNKDDTEVKSFETQGKDKEEVNQIEN